MKRILSYFFTRLALTIPMLFVLLTLLFVVLRVMPGDPVSIMLGGHASEEFIAEKKAELGLNKPLIAQYGDYLNQLIHLNPPSTPRSARPAPPARPTSAS